VNPNMGKETLGVYIMPNENMKDQLNALIKKVEKWVGALKVYSTPNHKLFFYMNTTISKTLEYLLIATIFLLQKSNRLVKLI